MKNTKMKKHKNRKKPAFTQKRKHFSTLFIRKWLKILLLSAVAYAAGIYLFINYAQNQARDFFQERTNTAIKNIITAFNGENDVLPLKNQIQLHFCGDAQALGITYLLYDSDTLEILADSNETLFLIKRRDHSSDASVTRIYTCPTNIISGWTEHRRKISDAQRSGMYLNEEIRLKSFYVDEDHFYPAEMEIEVTAHNNSDALIVMNYSGSGSGQTGNTDSTPYVPDIIFISEFAAPADATGSPAAWNNDDYYVPILAGYSSDSPCLYVAGTHTAHAFLAEQFENLKNGSDNLIPDDYEEGESLNRTFFARKEITLPTGESMTLLCSYHFDGWGTYGSAFVLIALVLFILGLFLALITGKLSYTRIKAQYDMEDYRKTIMNTMAHDLKSPLMGISGYAENLRDNIHSEKRKYYADSILENVNYMDQLIASVLALSQSENGSLNLEKEDTDIKKLIQDSLRKYHSQLEQLPLTATLSGELTLSVDPALFTRVVDNLVSNALKYASPDSTLTITLEPDNICFTNACSNDLSPVIGSLCEPFVTADESRSGKKGNGLGLALVKNICEYHGFAFKIKYEDHLFHATIIL